jgi:hypothetical protein
MSRETRLYRYLCQNPGWQPRDKIMHWTGYPSPKNHPVIAYVEFQNDVMRLNAQLAKSGRQTVRYPNTEDYQIVSVEQKAA